MSFLFIFGNWVSKNLELGFSILYKKQGFSVRTVCKQDETDIFFRTLCHLLSLLAAAAAASWNCSCSAWCCGTGRPSSCCMAAAAWAETEGTRPTLGPSQETSTSAALAQCRRTSRPLLLRRFRRRHWWSPPWSQGQAQAALLACRHLTKEGRSSFLRARLFISTPPYAVTNTRFF